MDLLIPYLFGLQGALLGYMGAHVAFSSYSGRPGFLRDNLESCAISERFEQQL